MGKKPPPPKNLGQDIKKFFDRKAEVNKNKAAARASPFAAPSSTVVKGLASGRSGRPSSSKQHPARSAPISRLPDNFLLSQDLDHELPGQVGWAHSPPSKVSGRSASEPPEDVSSRSSKLQAAPAASTQPAADAAAGATAAGRTSQAAEATQPVQASADTKVVSKSSSPGAAAGAVTSKLARASAARTASQQLKASQGNSQPAAPGQAAAAGARASKATAAGAAGAGAAAWAEVPAGASAASDDDLLLQEVLAAAATVPCTPASGIIASRSKGGKSSDRLLASARRLVRTPCTASTGKQGHKRKAMMELLEQVVQLQADKSLLGADLDACMLEDAEEEQQAKRAMASPRLALAMRALQASPAAATGMRAALQQQPQALPELDDSPGDGHAVLPQAADAAVAAAPGAARAAAAGPSRHAADEDLDPVLLEVLMETEKQAQERRASHRAASSSKQQSQQLRGMLHGLAQPHSQRSSSQRPGMVAGRVNSCPASLLHVPASQQQQQLAGAPAQPAGGVARSRLSASSLDEDGMVAGAAAGNRPGTGTQRSLLQQQALKNLSGQQQAAQQQQLQQEQQQQQLQHPPVQGGQHSVAASAAAAPGAAAAHSGSGSLAARYSKEMIEELLGGLDDDDLDSFDVQVPQVQQAQQVAQVAQVAQAGQTGQAAAPQVVQAHQAGQAGQAYQAGQAGQVGQAGQAAQAAQAAPHQHRQHHRQQVWQQRPAEQQETIVLGRAPGEAAAAGQQQRQPQEPPLAGSRRQLLHVVLEVERRQHEATVLLLNEFTGEEVVALLKPPWTEAHLQPGDTVNLMAPHGSCDANGRRRVELSHGQGLMVLHPDMLLSGTTITSAMPCARKAWLQERFAGDSNDRAVLGTLMHTLLAQGLHMALQGSLSHAELSAKVPGIIAAAASQLYAVGLDEQTASSRMQEQLLSLLQLLQRYVVPAPSGQLPDPSAALVDLGPGGMRSGSTALYVHDVVDIEENVWAPQYGLKGQIDATMRVSMHSMQQAQALRMSGASGAASGRGQGASGMQQQRQQGLQGQQGQQAQQGQGQAMQYSGFANSGDSWAAGAGGAGGGRAPAAGTSGAAAGPFGAAVFKGRLSGQQQPQQQQGRSFGQEISNSSVAAQQASGPGAKVAGSGSNRPGQQQGQVQQQAGGGGLPGFPGPDTLLVPFEFKSGRYYHSHRAQVSLYLLLLEQRYKHHVGSGLLCNLHSPQLQAVQHSDVDIAHLLNRRNVLASHLAGARPSAPPVFGDQHQCERCPQQQACAVYHRAVEGGTVDSSHMGAAFLGHTQHLSPSHCAFMAHWLRLLDLEDAASRRRRAEVWALPGQEREAAGGCIARLALAEEAAGTMDTAEGQQHLYTFSKDAASSAAAAAAAAEPCSLADSGFSVGDRAVLSLEGYHVAAARVVVHHLAKGSVTVASEKPLPAQRLLQSAAAEAQQQAGQASMPFLRSLWRLDKDEVASSSTTLRTNVLSLLTSTGRQAARLRQLVIDLEAPQQQVMISSSSTAGSAGDSSSDGAGGPVRGEEQVGVVLTQRNKYLRSAAAGMNPDQLAAVRKVLAMQDYALILGMPGTGKTTTIVHTLKALVAAGCSVLVTSYTNSAVDNILLKLLEEEQQAGQSQGQARAKAGAVPFIRLGRPQGVHPRLHGHMLGGEHFPDRSVAGMKGVVAGVQVVGCTCLSMNHPLLTGRTFDVALVDEASQISTPAVLAPLLKARSFVLVGDHYQLSPLVTSPEAAAQGYGVSLFRRLSEAHPGAVVALRRQYRMAADVMLLSNELVYGGRLVCGSEAVATAQLQLPLLQQVQGQLPAWLLPALDPARRVLFLDTDALPARDQMTNDVLTNPREAELVVQLAAALLKAGLPAEELGVVSPYKAQVALLQRQAAAGGCADVEVSTVDRYQGRDKQCILMSFVRSNTDREAGRLLADWQRVNVAITRAKTKLVLLGSASTLATVPLLAKLLELLRARGWCLQLDSSPAPAVALE